MSFNEAKSVIQKRNIKSYKQWREYRSSDEIPERMPKRPHNIYKSEGWVSYPNFFGYEKNQNRRKEFLTYDEAKKYLKRFNLNSYDSYKLFCKTEDKHRNIPVVPEKVYKNRGWISYPDFLGYDPKEILQLKKIKKWRSFIDARKFVRNLNLKNQIEWQRYAKSDEKPKDIPASPMKVYDDWINLKDWLGS